MGDKRPEVKEDKTPDLNIILRKAEANNHIAEKLEDELYRIVEEDMLQERKAFDESTTILCAIIQRLDNTNEELQRMEKHIDEMYQSGWYDKEVDE